MVVVASGKCWLSEVTYRVTKEQTLAAKNLVITKT